MLNRFLFSSCKEKKRLFSFVKECYERNLVEIEQSVLIADDIDYTVDVLENTKLLKPSLVKPLVTSSKLVLRNKDLTQLQTSTQACQILNAIQPYAEPEDQSVMREVYQFYQKHPYLFDKNQTSRLQYYYYYMNEKTQFEDTINIMEAEVSNTRMFTIIAQQLYKFEIHKDWNLIVRHDSDQQISVATITHKKSQKQLRIQGIWPNSYEDIGTCKQLIPNYDVLYLNLPPVAVTRKTGNLSFIESISQTIDQNQTYKEGQRRVHLHNIAGYFESVASKFKINQPQQLVTGIQQGFEVPYTLESILFSLQKNKELPKILLTDLDRGERVRFMLNDSKDVLEDLQILRMKWVNQVLAWVAKVQNFGCYSCGSKATGLIPPSNIIDSTDSIKFHRAQVSARLVAQELTQSDKSKHLFLVDESIFYLCLKEIITSPLPDNRVDLESYRAAFVNQNFRNTNHIETFKQFYNDADITNDLHKLSSSPMLDLKKFAEYRRSEQLRCGARDILL